MLNIPYFRLSTSDNQMEEISAMLNSFAVQPISIAPWTAYQYIPEVKFAIAHTGDSILLKYKVREKSILAVHRKINEAVYKDACVEFFISFDDTGYYNLEFNCVGNCLAAFGSDRHSRHFLPIYHIKEIGIKSEINANAEGGQVEWELSLKIPLSVFYKHDLKSLNGINCRMNLYKCGDDLPEPHYLVWSDIMSDEPDFHLPEFFGSGMFLSATDFKTKTTNHFINA